MDLERVAGPVAQAVAIYTLLPGCGRRPFPLSGALWPDPEDPGWARAQLLHNVLHA